jgi:hypothetical protein
VGYVVLDIRKLASKFPQEPANIMAVPAGIAATVEVESEGISQITPTGTAASEHWMKQRTSLDSPRSLSPPRSVVIVRDESELCYAYNYYVS